MKNLIDPKVIFNAGKNLTPREVNRRYRISVRKLNYLIRRHLIEPAVVDGKLVVAEGEIRRYLGLPEKVRRRHHASYLKTFGPGIITGAADDDPSGIGMYSAAGAKYGLTLTWLAVYLVPMMTAVQETVARIGIVTGKGLTGAVSKKYGKKILYPLVFLLLVANTINIGADIGAMVASFQLLVPINFYLGAIVLTLFMLFLEITFTYHRYARVLKWLTISLFAYIVAGVMIQPDWIKVFQSIVTPHIIFTAGFVAALVGVMGTTISPYLFFWQASEEIEEERDKGRAIGHAEHHKMAVRTEIKEMRKDTVTGMLFANIVFLFIVITTAFLLHDKNITEIETAAQAAEALRPMAGRFAYVIFNLGVFGVGLLAVPVLAGSSAYGMAELFGWHEGLDRKFTKARGFYGVIIFSMIIGLLLNFVGINPIKALVYAAVVNGIVAPILMYFIFTIGRDKKLMGENVNPRWVNVWGTVATLLMGGAAILLLVMSVLGIG